MHVVHVATVSTCKSDLKSRILEALILDGYYLQVKEKFQQGNAQQKYKEFRLEEDGILMHGNKVPDSCEIRKFILKEMHNVPYVEHQGYQKTFVVVRKENFWPSMKNDIENYNLDVWSAKK